MVHNPAPSFLPPVLARAIDAAKRRVPTLRKDGGTAVSACRAEATVPDSVDCWRTPWNEKLHRSIVPSIRFQPHGGPLAIGCGGLEETEPGSVIVSSGRGEPSRNLTTASAILSVAFSRDGSRLGASFGTSVRVWDTKTWEVVAEELTHSGTVYCVAFSQNGKMLASALSTNSVVVFSATNWERLVALSHSDSIYAIDFSPDSKTLAAGSYDSTALVYDTCTWECMRTLANHSIVFAVVFAPDGNLLATVALEFVVSIWDTTTWDRKYELTHADWVYDVAFSPMGTEFATASKDNLIYVWEAKSGQLLLALKGHSDDVRSLDYSPCGNLLASSAADGRVIVFSKPRFLLHQALRTTQARLGILERSNRAVMVAAGGTPNCSECSNRHAFWIERVCSTLYLPKPAISAVFHFLVHDIPKARW